MYNKVECKCTVWDSSRSPIPSCLFVNTSTDAAKQFVECKLLIIKLICLFRTTTGKRNWNNIRLEKVINLLDVRFKKLLCFIIHCIQFFIKDELRKASDTNVELDNLKSTLADLDSLISNGNFSLNSLPSNIQNSNEKETALSNQLKEKDIEIDSLKSQLSSLSQTLESSSDEMNESLMKQKAEYDTKIENASRDSVNKISIMKLAIQSLKNDICMWKEKAEMYENSLNMLKQVILVCLVKVYLLKIL